MQTIDFTKLQGAGNDFVLLDLIVQPELRSINDDKLAREICNRHTGIGADGLLLLERGKQAALKMRMFNPDGSEAEMCGNGLRCLVHYALQQGYAQPGSFSVETQAGISSVTYEDGGTINIWMGQVSPVPGLDMRYITRLDDYHFKIDVAGKPITLTCLSIGNPHAVLAVEDIESVDVTQLGPAIEDHPAFPQRINVMFAEQAKKNILVIPWERGAGATLACGSGACAVAVAMHLDQPADQSWDSEIKMPGGVLQVRGSQMEGVWLSGPAVEVFTGSYSAE